MELVYGIIRGIYTRYILSLLLFSLSLSISFFSFSFSANASNIESREHPCMYTGALDALYRKSPCKHENRGLAVAVVLGCEG